MLQRPLTRRVLRDIGGARTTAGLTGLRVPSVAGTPLLTRRLLVLERACWSEEESTVEERLWRIPVLGLGAFGAQVLTALAATRQRPHASGCPSRWSRGRSARANRSSWSPIGVRRRMRAMRPTSQASAVRTGASRSRSAHSPAAVRRTRGRRRWSRPGTPVGRLSRDQPPGAGPPDRAVPSRLACREDTGTHLGRPGHRRDADFLRADMLCVDLTDLQVLFTRSGRAMGAADAPRPRPDADGPAPRAGWSLARCHDAGPGPAGADHGDGEPGSTLYDIHEAVAQVRTMLSPEAWMIYGGMCLDELPQRPYR